MNAEFRPLLNQSKESEIQGQLTPHPTDTVRVIPDIVTRIRMDKDREISATVLEPLQCHCISRFAESHLDHPGRMRPHRTLTDVSAFKLFHLLSAPQERMSTLQILGLKVDVGMEVFHVGYLNPSRCAIKRHKPASNVIIRISYQEIKQY